MLYVNVSSIFFKSYSVDPISGHVIYVFDSTYLPSPEEVGDKQVYDLLIDELMDKLLSKLPRSPFSLVVFSSGFSKKKISWVYGIKMFAKLPKDLRGFLQKTYIVHESFFIRTVYQVLSNAMNIKLLNINSLQEGDLSSHNQSMVHVANLTELAELIDITTLRISLNVYLHDYQFNDYINLPQEYFTRLSSVGIRQYRQLIFDKIFKRLQIEAPTNELVFQKPGSYKKVNILLDVIERNNYIDLSQWDVFSLATVFLHFLKTKSHPLIPIQLILLPIEDNFQYTYTTFCKIVKSNHYFDLFEAIFPLFRSLLNATEITKHNVRTLSRALTPTLCREKVSMVTSDRLAIGTRFIGNLFEHFDAIMERIDRARTGRSHAISPIRQKEKTETQSEQELKEPQKQQAQCVFTVTSVPPLVPNPRKSSPTKYGKLDGNPSALQNFSRPQSPFSTNQGQERSSSSTSTLLGDYNYIPSLSPSDEVSNGFRINSDTTATQWDTNCCTSSRSPSSISSSSSHVPEAISQMVTEESDNLVLDNEEKLQPKSSLHESEIARLQLDDKFLQFDKQLKKRKQLSEKVGKQAKFSAEGYSDIKVGNKVSKLAALYEERLQGLKVINDIEATSGQR